MFNITHTILVWIVKGKYVKGNILDTSALVVIWISSNKEREGVEVSVQGGGERRWDMHQH